MLPDWPAPPSVHALQTTRRDGCSLPPFDSFNLGMHVGDDPELVRRNRDLLRTQLPGEPVWLEQVHGNDVLTAEAGQASPRADASFTRRTGVVCAVMTADCLPLLLCDEAGTVVGAIHAGWRGLAAGVIEAAARAMQAPPESLLAWLGPAIGPQAFEVGNEVFEAFAASDRAATQAFRPSGNGRWLADIYLLARLRLNALGIRRIYGGSFCTFSEQERFFSFRRDGRTGRMATLIWLA